MRIRVEFNVRFFFSLIEAHCDLHDYFDEKMRRVQKKVENLRKAASGLLMLMEINRILMAVFFSSTKS